MTNLELMICILLFSIVPIVIAIREIRFLLRVRRCTHSVNAEIGNLTESFWGRTRHRSHFRPTVQYTFGGERYWEDARHTYTYDTYSIGLPVIIYVDPNDPSVFFLPGERKKAVIDMLLPMLAAAIVLAVIFAQYRKSLQWEAHQQQMIEAMQQKITGGT